MDQKSVTRRKNAEQEIERKCKACNEIKPITEFNVAQNREGYRRHECKFCESSRKKAWYQANYEKARARQNEASRIRYEREVKNSPEHLAKLREYSKRCGNKAKDEAFMHYGGWVCACCGETERKFLTLDHINNDGHMRKKYGGEPRASRQLYGWLRKMGYPEGFRVLCMNCNWGRSQNGGVCPHQEGSTTSRKAYTQAGGSASDLNEVMR